MPRVLFKVTVFTLLAQMACSQAAQTEVPVATDIPQPVATEPEKPTRPTWTEHAKGGGCKPCSAFGKVLVGLQDHMATGDDQEGRLVAFHSTSWLNGSLENEKLT